LKTEFDEIKKAYSSLVWIEDNQYLLVHKGYSNRPEMPEANPNLIKMFNERKPSFQLEPAKNSI